MRKFFLTVLTVSWLASCTGVSLNSDEVRTGPGPGTITGPGVIYSLPKTFVTLTVSLGKIEFPTADQQKRLSALKKKIAGLKIQITTQKKAIAKAPKDANLKTKLKTLEKDLTNEKAAMATLEAKITKVRGLSSSAAAGVVLADPDATYRINYDHAIGSDDTVEIKTSIDGLLISISTTANDKSATIATQIFQVAGEGAAFFATGGISSAFKSLSVSQRVLSFDAPLVAPPDTDSKRCVEQKDFKASFLMDPLDPVRAYRSLSEIAKQITRTKDGDGPDCIRLILYDANLDVIYDSETAARLSATPKLDTYKTEREGWRDVDQCTRGVCYRRLGTLFLEVRHTALPSLTGPILMGIPQAGEVGYIEFQRRAFVENSAEAVFTKGMLTSLKYTDPSEVLGFVSIPVDALKAIFGIPAAIFATGESQADAELAISNARLKILKDQVATAQQQLELQNALEALTAE